MKRIFLTLIIILFLKSLVNAQTGQFAVVRPDGTTYICPSWDSAYNKSADGDFIYLPGITITGNITIDKQITIYGTGHYPDSTLVTGKTVFSGSVTILKQVHLEGFEIQNGITLTNISGNNSSFIKIKSYNLVCNGTSGHYINQCAFFAIGFSSPCNPIDNIFVSNSILSAIDNITNSVIQNCIFLGNDGGIYHYPWYISSANTIYKNNIFHGIYAIGFPNTSCFSIVGNICNNNVFVFGEIGNYNNGNFTGQNPDLIFVNHPYGGGFSYSDNYHLKPDSPYLTAGDDGTQIGIYGGDTPYNEDAVPSNPHLYFKHVATQTNNSGQLNIQFKVRTNN